MGDVFRAGCQTIELHLNQEASEVTGLVGPDSHRLQEIQNPVLTSVSLCFTVTSIDGDLCVDLFPEAIGMDGYARRIFEDGKSITYKLKLARSSDGDFGHAA